MIGYSPILLCSRVKSHQNMSIKNSLQGVAKGEALSSVWNRTYNCQFNNLCMSRVLNKSENLFDRVRQPVGRKTSKRVRSVERDGKLLEEEGN